MKPKILIIVQGGAVQHISATQDMDIFIADKDEIIDAHKKETYSPDSVYENPEEFDKLVDKEFEE